MLDEYRIRMAFIYWQNAALKSAFTDILRNNNCGLSMDNLILTELLLLSTSSVKQEFFKCVSILSMVLQKWISFKNFNIFFQMFIIPFKSEATTIQAIVFETTVIINLTFNSSGINWD